MKKQILGSLFICTLFALVGGEFSRASAPMSTAAPLGFFKTHLGAFEVTALSDGTVDLEMSKLLTHIKPIEYQKALRDHYLEDPIETSDNAYLINTGTKLVLIDTGAGKLFGPTLGKVVASLKAAGYQPEQVDIVLITHMHPDHIGGLMTEGKLTFPNATLYIDKMETDFWLSEENMAKAPEANKGFFQGAMASVNPYLKAGKLKSLTADSEVVPGIKNHASRGHTAGHTTFIVESQGKKLVLMGDLVHVAAIQFAKPSVCIQFDSDPAAAEAERKLAFSEAARGSYLIGASHLSFPGMGHIRADKKAFEFIPINYTR